MIEYENLNKSNALFFDEYKQEFNSVLESGWFILGDKVRSFEKNFADYCSSKYCIGVANGLDALIISLRCLELDKDSEVIVPSNTYIATILSILHNGLKPVLVEPDINTYNIDPLKIEENISNKTKALMIVHLYGKSCDMDPIMKICKKYNLHLIEDCAQSHGARYKNKIVGTFGVMGAYSFYPTKNLGALGDSGAIVTDDDKINEIILRMRNYGSKIKYYNDIIGFNSRLDEIQASFLSIKLKYLDKINSHKRKLAKLYFKYLRDDFIKPFQDGDYYDVFHIYNIRHVKRDLLKEYLLKNEIKTEIHYPVPPNKQKAMNGIFDEKEYPISEEIHNTTLSLPISYFHQEEDVMKVIEVMNKF
jgi:dTDP-4-amino-4,6-dideoxygalactose transaminase